jgi:hypothetical protein
MAIKAVNTLPVFVNITNGTSPVFTSVGASGDSVPLSGRYTLVAFRSGTAACTVTLDSVIPSSYGTDVDGKVVLSTSDEQWILIDNSNRRFDQGVVAGTSGLANLTYTTSIGVTLAVANIP